MVFGVLIVLNATFILLAAGRTMLDITGGLAACTGTDEGLAAFEASEAMFGAISILLCLTAVLTSVIQPRLGRPTGTVRSQSWRHVLIALQPARA